MNRIKLRETLRRAGIADGLYEIVGLHRAAHPGTEFSFLEERDGEWVVGVEERGRRGTIARFRTEDEACRFFHDRLVRIWTAAPAAPQTPEEEEHGRRVTEETVRRVRDMMKARED